MAHPHPLPAEQLQALQRALQSRHKRHLARDERLQVGHRVEEALETLTLDVVRGPELFRFEARVDALQVRRGSSTDLLMDFLDGVLGEWLQGGREAYPTLEFSPYQFEGVTVLLRGGAERPDLEAEADALLARGTPRE